MKPHELLRMCADKLQQYSDVNNTLHHIFRNQVPGVMLTHARDTGRFPFAGGGTELLSANQAHTNYFVPVHRALSYVAQQLKLEAKALRE